MKILKVKQQEIVDNMGACLECMTLGVGKTNSIALTSVTGSGKTLMLSHVIKNNRSPVYLFLTPGTKLLDQSMTVLRKELAGLANVKRLNRETIQDIPAPGDVYVGNWESLTKTSTKEARHLTRTDLEGRSFNEWVLAISTAGIPLALVIDECHHGRSSEVTNIQSITQEIEDAMKSNNTPFVLIDSSATLLKLSSRSYETFGMTYADCAEEGLLKLNFHINAGLSSRGKAGLESLITTAMLRHGYITRVSAESEDCRTFNPLVCVVLPDDTSAKGGEAKAMGKGTRTMNQSIKILEDLGVDTETEVAYHMNGKSKNMLGISDANSPIKVLFYKKALSAGWDCPRAYIMVDLRGSASEITNAQNFGRIMRSFDAKHYRNEVLNTAYYYSENVDPEDIARNVGALDERFAVFSDAAVFSINERYRDLSALFTKKRIKQTQTKKKVTSEYVDTSVLNALRKSIADSVIQNIDLEAEYVHILEEKIIKMISVVSDEDSSRLSAEVKQPLGSHAFNFTSPESAMDRLVGGIAREMKRNDKFSTRTPLEMNTIAAKLVRTLQTELAQKIHQENGGVGRPESATKRRASTILAAEKNMEFVLQAAGRYAEEYPTNVEYVHLDSGIFKLPGSARLPHSMVETKRKTLYGKLDEAGEFHYYTFKPASVPEEDFEAEVSKIKKVSVIQKLPQTGVMSLSIALSKTTFTPDYMVVVGTNRSAKPIFIEVKGVKSQDSKDLLREKAEAMREFEKLHGISAALVQQDSDGKFRTYGDRKTLEAFILG